MRTVLQITLPLLVGIVSCNKLPQACIEVDSSSASVGTAITFTSCSKNALSYIWTIQGPAGAAENTIQWSEETFSRAFSVQGSYTVELVAYKKYSWVGQSRATSTTVTIN